MSITEKQKQSIENEWFSWKGWNDQGDFALSFNNIVLQKQIGKFPAGKKFDAAYLDLQHGILQLSDLGEEIKKKGRISYRPLILRGEYKVHLTIGDILNEPE